MSETTTAETATDSVDDRIPRNASDPDGVSISQPVVRLLKSLELISAPEELKRGPISRAVLGAQDGFTLVRTGVLSATRGGLAAFGVTGAAGAAAAASGFWGSSTGSVQTAIVAGGSFMVAVSVAAMCFLLASDVRSRASATTEQITQRGAVVVAFLEATATMQRRPPDETALIEFLKAVVPFDGRTTAKVDATRETVKNFKIQDGIVTAKVLDAWRPLSELSEVQVAAAPEPPSPPSTPLPPSKISASNGKSRSKA